MATHTYARRRYAVRMTTYRFRDREKILTPRAHRLHFRRSMTVVVISMVIASWMFWLATLVFAGRVFARRSPRPAALPPVSILKPVRGVDFEVRENFISHCEQQYPELEILFGVADADDPVVPIIRELQRTYGQNRVRLVIAPNEAANPKAGLLDALARHARHDVLITTDSDVRLPPDGVSRAVERLADPAVGLVTFPYRGGRPLSPAAVLEALGMEAEFIPSAIVGHAILPVPFALGPGNALRRQALERIGGFSAVANYLADDYQLGFKLGAAGYRVEFGDLVISAVLGRTSMKTWWTREVRWARTIRMCRRAHYLGILLTFSTPLALIAAIAGGWWPGLLGSLALRWFVAWRMTQWMGDRVLRRWLWAVPLRDLCSPLIWLAGMSGREVIWRGRRFPVGELCGPPSAVRATA